MNIPGYDAWKLSTPEDDYERKGGKLCPFCGSSSTQHCEFADEIEGMECPWDASEPDPDYLRDLQQDSQS